MRGPQCGRAAMLSLRGHLRRRPVPLWGFPSAHPGGRPCPMSRDCPVWPPAWALGVSSWPEGRSLDSWVLVQASKVSTRLCASGMGQAELGSSGLGVRQPSLRPRYPWQGAQLLRCLSLCPRHLSCLFFFFFLNQKGRGGEGRKGSPSPGPRLGVWGDRLTLCFGSRVLLTPSNFTPSLDTRSLSYSICGEWPSRAAEGMDCLEH